MGEHRGAVMFFREMNPLFSLLSLPLVYRGGRPLLENNTPSLATLIFHISTRTKA